MFKTNRDQFNDNQVIYCLYFDRHSNSEAFK